MTENEEKEILLYFSATGIPVYIFKGDVLVQKYSHSLQDFNLPLLLFSSLRMPLPDIWYSFTPESIYFGGISLSSGSEKHHDGKTLVLGPVVLSECSFKQAEDICRRLGLHHRERTTIQTYFDRIGPCDPQKFINNLHLICRLLAFEYTKQIPCVPFQWHIPYPITEYPTSNNLPKISELETENAILSCIRSGNLYEMNCLLDEQLMIPNFTDLSLADRRICTLGFNMVAWDTALHAGANELLAADIRNRFIHLIKHANTKAELSYLFTQCFREYTIQVADSHTLSNNAPIIKKIDQYIHTHYDRKITSTTLAKIFHINNSYLCHLFKKETGMTIGDYVQQQKIQEAKRLLKGSLFSIAEISEILSFSSQSYFCSVFKKITGMTPASFRHSDTSVSPEHTT